MKRKTTVLILSLLVMLPIGARSSGSYAITSGYDIYGLHDDPVFLSSVPIGISSDRYFEDGYLGMISEFDCYIPLHYDFGEHRSPEDTFLDTLYIDYALGPSLKVSFNHMDLFFSAGWFGALRYLHFNNGGGFSLLLSTGPRMKIGCDVYITDVVSIRLAVDGSLYLIKKDFTRSDEIETGLTAFSVTPEIGMAIHFNDDWSFGRKWGK